MKAIIVPKNKTGGVVSTTVLGTGALIISVIVLLVVVSTLFSADLFVDARLTNTTVNETQTVSTSGVKFGDNTRHGAVCTLTTAKNGTGGETIGSGNYTVVGCLITATATSEYNNSAWNLDVSTVYDSDSEKYSEDMNTNFTEGIGNISEKIPVILLIVAVVFLFGALVLLMRNANAMGISNQGSL